MMNRMKSTTSGTIDSSAGTRMPVLAIPGFGLGDVSMYYLMANLKKRGYTVYGAGIGLNVLTHYRNIDMLANRLLQIAETHNERVAIVGHSIGGTYAKILADRYPKVASVVVALDSPLARAHPHSISGRLAYGYRRALRKTLNKVAIEKDWQKIAFKEDVRSHPAVPLYLIETVTSDNRVREVNLRSDVNRFGVQATHTSILLKGRTVALIDSILRKESAHASNSS